MKKLYALLGVKELQGAHVGIEIEAEGEGMTLVASPNWKSEDDQSLRGRFPDQRHEFVSSVLPKDKIEGAIDELINLQKDARFNFSFRTSTHVHVNCTDMTPDEITTFVYIYYLMERDMMRYCGPARNNNRFCLRMVDSEFQLDILDGLMENGFRDIRVFVDEGMRYAACNLAALVKYGTLEFRGMRGSLDKDVLMNWINQLLHLRDLAIKFGNPFSVYEAALNDSAKFVVDYYGDRADVFANNDSVRNLEEALSLTINIPFSYKRIVAHRVEPPNPIKKRFHLDRVVANVVPAAQPDFNIAGEVNRRIAQVLFEQNARNAEPALPANPDDLLVDF